jgi:eukaryotic-like serine/threonine-protein kinase
MVNSGVLHERYRITEPLASGGMGKVFCATDERLGRTVAVKLLRDDLAHDERFVERFRREARAAASLSHPNVAGVYDYGEDNGQHFIVMEYVEGRDLARLLREDGPLSSDRAARIAAQAADALGHAHSAGLVHRDVKPANVIVMEGDRVKVTDFGIARAAGDATLTATGSVLGTAHYLAPEQAEGNPAGPPSDIYSLGIVLYEMLTGALPFTGDSALAVAMRHVNDDVPAPSQLNDSVPAPLDSIVARATAKDPANRFPDARSMAVALTEAAAPTGGNGAGPIPATAVLPTGGATTAVGAQSVWPIPGDRWNPQRVGRAVVFALVTLVVVALVLLLWRLANGAEPERSTGPPENSQEQDPVTEPEVPPSEEMPILIGLNYEEATTFLEAQGYEVTVEPVEHEAEEGTVVDTSPRPEENLEEAQEVILYVSAGEGDEDDEKGNGKGKGNGKDKHDEEGDD